MVYGTVNSLMRRSRACRPNILKRCRRGNQLGGRLRLFCTFRFNSAAMTCVRLLLSLPPQDIEHQRVAYEAKKAEGDAEWEAPKLVGWDRA